MPVEPPRRQGGKKGLLIAGIVIVVVLLAAAAYFWVLPMGQASGYKAKLQTAYASQRTALQSAMDELSKKDVFAGTSVNDNDTDNQDLAAAAKLIDAAQKQTTALNQDSVLPFLPGATALGVGKDALALHDKVKDYVATSTSFLDDFQKLDKFISDLNAIGENQAPPALAALNAIKGPDKTSLLAQTSAADAPMSKLVDALRKTTAPDDLKDFINNFIDYLAQAQTAISDINKGLTSNDVATVENASLTLVSAGSNIGLLTKTNPLSVVQSKDSKIQQQLTAAKNASIAF